MEATERRIEQARRQQMRYLLTLDPASRLRRLREILRVAQRRRAKINRALALQLRRSRMQQRGETRERRTPSDARPSSRVYVHLKGELGFWCTAGRKPTRRELCGERGVATVVTDWSPWDDLEYWAGHGPQD